MSEEFEAVEAVDAVEELETEAHGEPTELLDEEEMEVETTIYRVVTRSEEKSIDGRIEAVDEAKAISKESGQNALVDYVLETRKGRRL